MLKNPRQNYVELEAHYNTADGSVTRTQQCLHCGHVDVLERQRANGKTDFPIVNHVIKEHLS